jgi:hypothetical protein
MTGREHCDEILRLIDEVLAEIARERMAPVAVARFATAGAR